MREIPFSPEMMQSIQGAAGIDGKPLECNSNTEQIEEMKEALILALEELTERQLQCIQMYFWDNMTQQEIAQELGIKRPVVTEHILKAIAKLRQSKFLVKFTD